MAFCIHCGAHLEDGHRFCGRCGSPVAGQPPVVPAAAPAYTPPVVQEPVHTTPIVQEPAPVTPVIEEPTYTAPVIEEPAYTAPAIEEPAYSAPVIEEPAYTAPVIEEPAYTAPVAEPVVEAPVQAAPVAAAPAEDAGATVVLEAPAAQEATAPLSAAPITREHVRNSATPSGAKPMPFGNKSARGNSASYSYASQEKVSKPAKEPAAKPRRKFLSVFCSVLLCILLVVMMLPTYALVTARTALTKETFLNIMYRIDLDEIPASIIDEYDEDLQGLSFAEALCEAVNEEVNYYTGNYILDGQEVYFGWEDLTPQRLDSFLKDTTFLPFIAEHAEGIVKAILACDSTYTISDRALYTLLAENVPYIVEEFNVPVDVENYDLFAEDLVAGVSIGELELPNWSYSEREALSLVNTALSFYGIGAMCLVLLVLALLLFLANRKDPMYFVRDMGIVFVVGNIIPLLLIVAGRISVSTFAGVDAVKYVACTLFSCVVESSMLIFGIVFLLGIVLLITNGIVRKIQRKRAK